MDDYQSQFASLLSNFTSKVTALASQAAVEAASAAFGEQRARAPKPRRIPAPTKRRASTVSREPVDTAATEAQVVSYLLHKPGLRMDQLGEALKLPTSHLKPIVRKLLADRMLRAKGNTRGRQYFPTKGATSATSSADKATKARGRRGSTTKARRGRGKR